MLHSIIHCEVTANETQVYHMQSQPGQGTIVPFEPVEGFTCKSSVHEVLFH